MISCKLRFHVCKRVKCWCISTHYVHWITLSQINGKSIVYNVKNLVKFLRKICLPLSNPPKRRKSILAVTILNRIKGMLNQRSNSDGNPVLPTERTYTNDLRDKNTSLCTNISTFYAFAHIFLISFLSH